ncbi:MAG: peptidoglycan editing factor PgeF [Candidatus Binatia bacterium]
MPPPAAPDRAPPALRVAAWRAIPGLTHGFFGRAGGVSTGALASLNLSSLVGDDPAAVQTNWRQVGRAVPATAIVRMRQVHGARVVPVEHAEQVVGDADGLATTVAGLALAVLTADCVPLLCIAPAHGAVMALHAGWRGTLAGIAAVALEQAQQRLGIAPAEWQVALGPSIDACCYEVEAPLGARMVERWGAMPDAWRPAGAHGQLGLRQVNRRILLEQGVPDDQIMIIGPCTACEHGAYFSHRRSAGLAGRQASLIALTRPA